MISNFLFISLNASKNVSEQVVVLNFGTPYDSLVILVVTSIGSALGIVLKAPRKVDVYVPHFVTLVALGFRKTFQWRIRNPSHGRKRLETDFLT